MIDVNAQMAVGIRCQLITTIDGGRSRFIIVHIVCNIKIWNNSHPCVGAGCLYRDLSAFVHDTLQLCRILQILTSENLRSLIILRIIIKAIGVWILSCWNRFFIVGHLHFRTACAPSLIFGNVFHLV